MSIKSKLVLGAGLYLLTCAAAQAEINVGVSLGGPAVVPAYAAPVPAYVAPYPAYYDPHHRWHNYDYWRANHHDDRGHPWEHRW